VPLQGALFPILEISIMPTMQDITMFLHVVIALLVIYQIVRGELRGADIKAVIDVVNALFAGPDNPTPPADQPPQ
jgi:hypothetical protein